MSSTTSAAKRVQKGVKKVFPDLAISTKEVYNAISLLTLIFGLYACLYLAIGKVFLPPTGAAWAIIFIWFAALVLGMTVDRVQIPGPLGMIVAGIMLRNIHNGYIISGLKSSWTKEFRGIALAAIFLRSGLELDLGIFKRVGPAALRLLFIPGLVEAFFDGGMIKAILGVPVTFAFALGFIMKAVGPALVIQCMFEVQSKRLGLDKAIPAVVVAAASFDDAIAITGYTIFINVAVTGSGNQAWQIMHGPLSVLFGFIAGLGAALLCAPTKLWNNVYKRTVVVWFCALVMKFFFDKYNFTSGGAIGSLTLGLVIKELWTRGWPRWGAQEGEHGPHLARTVEKHTRWFWKYIMCPLLFGIIGTQMNFSTLPTNVIPKVVGIIFAGLAVRTPTTFLVMFGSGYTVREKLFFAIAWTPKATVQATLALLPLDQVNALIPKNDPRYAAYRAYANDALVIAVFTILICGSLGTVLIRWFSPFLLNKTPLPSEEQDGHGGDLEQGPALTMRKSFGSGRYKNPITDNMQPFGIESRPAHPLALSEIDQASQHDKLHLKEHNSVLAAYLDHFESIAEEVDIKASSNDDPYLEQTANRLKANIRALRKNIVDDTGARPAPGEVEGAQAFSRASKNFRNRHPHNGQQNKDSSDQTNSVT